MKKEVNVFLYTFLIITLLLFVFYFEIDKRLYETSTDSDFAVFVHSTLTVCLSVLLQFAIYFTNNLFLISKLKRGSILIQVLIFFTLIYASIQLTSAYVADFETYNHAYVGFEIRIKKYLISLTLALILTSLILVKLKFKGINANNHLIENASGPSKFGFYRFPMILLISILLKIIIDTCDFHFSRWFNTFLMTEINGLLILNLTLQLTVFFIKKIKFNFKNQLIQYSVFLSICLFLFVFCFFGVVSFFELLEVIDFIFPNNIDVSYHKTYRAFSFDVFSLFLFSNLFVFIINLFITKINNKNQQQKSIIPK